MSLHDAYARVTPFELVFPDPEAASELVRRIDEEAAGGGSDPSDPHQLVAMGAVGAFLAGLREADDPPEALHSFGALVYHAVHFERARRPLYLLSTHAARYLVDGAPEGPVRPTDPAGYLQLPQHLFWAEPTPGAAESVDGIFWTVAGPGILHTMVVTGIRAERPGLAVMPLPEAPLEDAGRWLQADVREGEADFSTTLPGSDIDRLYAFRAAGEVLKLVGRFFAFTASTPSALERGETVDASGPPGPTTLPFSRVTLG